MRLSPILPFSSEHVNEQTWVDIWHRINIWHLYPMADLPASSCPGWGNAQPCPTHSSPGKGSQCGRSATCTGRGCFSRIIMIKNCKSAMPHSGRWWNFLGKGRDGAIAGAEIQKKRLSSEQRQERYKEATWQQKIMEIILHLLYQLQYWPGSAISYKDSTYILQLEFWFIPWLFHAWTIAIMFVPSYFFFYPHTTRLFLQELPCLLCFSLKYPCCSHTFFLTVILLHVFSYIWNQDLNFNVSRQ